MTHPLDSCRIKIERAREHIQYLDSAIQRLLANSYGVMRDRNADTGYIEFRVRRSDDRETLARFAVIAGEIAHHLRSSFDHLAWQLVRANGNPHPDTLHPRAEFPIYADRKKYVSRGAGKIKAAGKEAAAVVERLQPYNRGDGCKSDPLWIIHYLDIVDKHKLLPVIASVVEVEKPEALPWKIISHDSGITTTLSPEHPRGADPFARIRVFDPKDGTIILSAPPAYMDVNFEVRFEIVLGNIGSLRHQSVVVTLQRLCDATMDIINQFSSFF